MHDTTVIPSALTAPPVENWGFLTCNRCSYRWMKRADTEPKKCPRCQTATWKQKRPTTLDMIGAPPAKMGDIFDPKMLLVVKNLPETHQLMADTIDAASYGIKALDECKKLFERARSHAATALNILESLITACRLRQLPQEAAEGTTNGSGGKIPQVTQDEAARATSAHSALPADTPALAPRLAQEMQLEIPTSGPTAKPAARSRRRSTKPKAPAPRGSKAVHKQRSVRT